MDGHRMMKFNAESDLEHFIQLTEDFVISSLIRHGEALQNVLVLELPVNETVTKDLFISPLFLRC